MALQKLKEASAWLELSQGYGVGDNLRYNLFGVEPPCTQTFTNILELGKESPIRLTVYSLIKRYWKVWVSENIVDLETSGNWRKRLRCTKCKEATRVSGI